MNSKGRGGNKANLRWKSLKIVDERFFRGHLFLTSSPVSMEKPSSKMTALMGSCSTPAVENFFSSSDYPGSPSRLFFEWFFRKDDLVLVGIYFINNSRVDYSIYGRLDFQGLSKKLKGFLRVPGWKTKGIRMAPWGNPFSDSVWEDWGTLGKIRGITTRRKRIL